MRILETGKKKCRGFTLIEILIVLLLFSVVVAVAVPNFLAMQAKQQVKRVKEQLSEDLILLRNEAITNDHSITLNFYPGEEYYRFTINRETFEHALTPLTVMEPVAEKESEKTAELKITFFGDGTSSGAEIVFVDKNTRKEYPCRVAPENSRLDWSVESE